MRRIGLVTLAAATVLRLALAADAAFAIETSAEARTVPAQAPLDLEAPNALRAPGEPAGARPEPLKRVSLEQRLGENVPLDIELRDEKGRTVRLGDYFGTRPVVLSLVYYECPMLCTLVLNGLTKALKVLTFDVGEEFDVVTVSFDPREGPALAAKKKATYLRDYDRSGASAGWHFLTGDAAAIEALARSVGFNYTYVPEEKQFAHPAAIMVLTPEGKLARYLSGVEYAPRDLRLALVEAGRGEIGNPVDHVLLYCYRYDPTTGKYGAVAMNLIRLGGVATVLALGGFILVMRRRELSARRASGGGATG